MALRGSRSRSFAGARATTAHSSWQRAMPYSTCGPRWDILEQHLAGGCNSKLFLENSCLH